MKGKNHRGGGVGFHIFIIFNMNKGPIFGRIFGRTYDWISALSGYPEIAKPNVKRHLDYMYIQPCPDKRPVISFFWISSYSLFKLLGYIHRCESILF